MKKILKRTLCVILTLALVLGLALVGSAKNVFDRNAYATIITGSDFQGNASEAYDRFGRIVDVAKNDGMPDAGSMLVGGDYTLVLLDNAVPGISRIRGVFCEKFPNADPQSVVCIQGNHDNPKKEFADTGFYDMGAYCLYVINENDFPWKQSSKSDKKVKAVAADVEAKLEDMIESGDKRPVIVMTHVPLHHTMRNGGGDNMYSSYIFNVLNKKAEKLDIIFIFGHNHSSAYDDYIGGSVNFMKPGDTIRIPFADKKGEDCYTEETLNFTYTNCGYLGYSNNHATETSTDLLTMGIIQLSSHNIRFIKYSEDGLYSINNISRKNSGTDVKTPVYPEMDDRCLCHSDIPVLRNIWKIFIFCCKLFNANRYCVCGECHY